MDPIVDEGINGASRVSIDYWPATQSASNSWWETTNWFRVSSGQGSSASTTSDAAAEAKFTRRSSPSLSPELHGVESSFVAQACVLPELTPTRAVPGFASCYNRFITASTTTSTTTTTSVIGGQLSTSSKQRFLAACPPGLSRTVLRSVQDYIFLPLVHPSLFRSIGVAPSVGVLLSGAPGSGKNRLVNAVVDHLRVYFQKIDCSQLLVQASPTLPQGGSGMLASTFATLRKNAPAILFLDHIDLIGGVGGDSKQGGASALMVQVKATLRAQLDEISHIQTLRAPTPMDLANGAPAAIAAAQHGNVLVIAATDRPEAVSTDLLRPGRFDRHISLSKPDVGGRNRILEQLTAKMKLHPDVDLAEISSRCEGYLPSDLAGVCQEAGLQCIHETLQLAGEDNWLLPLDGSPVQSGGTTNAASEQSEALMPDILIAHRHFLRAIEHTVPGTMRDVQVKVPKVSWDDVGGQSEVKQLLKETVEYPMLFPQVFSQFGLNPSSGVLLYGPPGCGKTMMAKAIASQSRANFMAVKGPELLNQYFGESEHNVRQLFIKAQQNAPCVLFFDELDSLARRRGSGGGSDPTADRVLNQLLCEMDVHAHGAAQTKPSRHKRAREEGGAGELLHKAIFVIGATNRPDALDPALLRPGRLDQLVYVGLPDQDSRFNILRNSLRRVPLSQGVRAHDMHYLRELARRCQGFSGADMALLVNKASRQAIARHISNVQAAQSSTDHPLSQPADSPTVAGSATEQQPREGEQEESEESQDVVLEMDFEQVMANLRPSVGFRELAYFESFNRSLEAAKSSLTSASASASSSASASGPCPSTVSPDLIM